MTGTNHQIALYGNMILCNVATDPVVKLIFLVLTILSFIAWLAAND